MADSNKGSITTGAIFIIVIAFFLQVLFVYADTKDTPNKAVAEFAKACFGLDSSMADRLCQESLIVDGVNVVDKYIDSVTTKAKAEGFRPFFTKNFLYHVQTNTVSKNDNKAKIRLTCEIKHPLRSFFTKESSRKIDETIDLINEDGKWKVCGDVFSLCS
ncbi:MAG: hypothetical protein KJ550_01570 [Proteobacteria bacterium]|nr:hypothetical protein [Desulfobacteraceae bacterium]MBU2522143.1 hypothetical protein [Pseudomonadota bacterium]MBU3981419.1 hypothetical protein [Pseudomonadota bacterium]MBU4012137.1 hypothetical protein [Pseudomonadota bacterium]MBU4067100.1 hypothetical protein [Pseudomonadota bacterium]